MRLFALGGARHLEAPVASLLGIAADPLEERGFADGEHKSRPMVSVGGGDVFILQGLDGRPGDSVNDRLVRLLFFIAACREDGASRITAVVPYLAYSRKDRKTKARDPVTTRYVARLFEAAGADCVVTIDVHNVAAFQNAFRKRTLHLTAAPLFCKAMEEVAGSSAVTVASPDAGGVKRAQLLKEAYEAATGTQAGFALMEKRRSRGVLSGELFAGDVEGRAVFIVDDMIASGGTMLRAAEACRQHGAISVHALATHLLPGPEARAFLQSPLLDSIVMTDSIAIDPDRPEKVMVLTVAPLVAEAIRRLAANEPLADLEGLAD
jgi:ribose-phosphate pyrophosphokinase